MRIARSPTLTVGLTDALSGHRCQLTELTIACPNLTNPGRFLRTLLFSSARRPGSLPRGADWAEDAEAISVGAQAAGALFGVHVLVRPAHQVLLAGGDACAEADRLA